MDTPVNFERAEPRFPGQFSASVNNPDALVFRRNDFLDPGSSVVFGTVTKIPTVGTHAQHLAQVAAASFSSIPSLADFLQQRGIPVNVIVYLPSVVRAAYQGPYPVCLASNYDAVAVQVGNRIELIGKIHGVHRDQTKTRKPYVFVNFSDWRGRAVKLAIWSEGLDALGSDAPNESWIGRWVSVIGMVDPAYARKRGGYSHLSITIAQKGQIQTLNEQEANFRISGVQGAPRESTSAPTAGNARIVQGMGGSASSNPTPIRTPGNGTQATPAQSANSQTVERMRRATGVAAPTSAPTPVPRAPAPQRSSQPQQTQQPSKSGAGCFGVLVCFFIVFFVLRGLGS